MWSDGVNKARWLATGNENRFYYEPRLNLSDKTVIVKSLTIETEEGNPHREWIETRFLTRQGTEWFGYSYVWNDEQTEGTLLDTKGTDRVFKIKVAKSKDYPGRFKRTELALPKPIRVHGLPQPSRQLGPGAERSPIQHKARLRFLHQQPNARPRTSGRTRYRIRASDVKTNSTETEGCREDDKEIDAQFADEFATRDQRQPKRSSLLTYSPEKLRKLVDPRDPKAVLPPTFSFLYLHYGILRLAVLRLAAEIRRMELDFTTVDKMKIVNVNPVHSTFGLKEAKIVAPGQPDRSVLLHRIAQRGKGHMPPLATRVVDRDTVDLLRTWITQLRIDEKKK